MQQSSNRNYLTIYLINQFEENVLVAAARNETSAASVERRICSEEA